MSLAGVKSFEDLRRRKDLRDELLAIEIANEAENERRVKDYKNPYAPKAVPPTYKTVSEQKKDVMLLEREALKVLTDIGIDYSEARDVILWLRQNDDRLTKFISYAGSMKREILRRGNPHFIDSQFAINIIRPVLANADLAIGLTSSGTQYSSISKLIDDFDIKPDLDALKVLLDDIGDEKFDVLCADIKEQMGFLIGVYPTDDVFDRIRLYEPPIQIDLGRKLSDLNSKYHIPTSNSLKDIIHTLRELNSNDDESLGSFLKNLKVRLSYNTKSLVADYNAFTDDVGRAEDASDKLQGKKIDDQIDRAVSSPEVAGDIEADDVRANTGHASLGVDEQLENAQALKQLTLNPPSKEVRMLTQFMIDNDIQDIEEIKKLADAQGFALSEEDMQHLMRVMATLHRPPQAPSQKDIMMARQAEISKRADAQRKARLDLEQSGRSMTSGEYANYLRIQKRQDEVSGLTQQTKDRLAFQYAELIDVLAGKDRVDSDRYNEILAEYTQLNDNERVIVDGLIDDEIKKTKATRVPIRERNKNPKTESTITRKIADSILKLSNADIHLAHFLIQMVITDRELSEDQKRNIEADPHITYVVYEGERVPKISVILRQLNTGDEQLDIQSLTEVLGYLNHYIGEMSQAPPRVAEEKDERKYADKLEDKRETKQQEYKPEPQKVRNSVKNLDEAEEHFGEFIRELDGRDPEDQKYLIRNLIDVAVRELPDAPPKKTVNKYFREFDGEGKTELLKILKSFYDYKVQLAEQDAKEYKSKHFGVSTRGYSTVQKLEYGLGVKRKVGKGVEAVSSEPYKTFGRFLIHVPSLDDNIANFKYPSKASIPHIKRKQITDDYKEFLKDLLQSGKINEKDYKRLCEEERDHFSSVVKGAGLLETLKIKPPKQNKKDLDRYELLIGEYKAGNNSPVMIKELRSLIIKFMDEGKIKRKDGQSLLVDLSTL